MALAAEDIQANCKQILANRKQKESSREEVVGSVYNAAVDQFRLRGTSDVAGIRLEYVVRSFKKPKPKTAFYSHPLHYPDTSDLLRDARTWNEAYASNARANNSRSKMSVEEILDQAADYCINKSKDGRITLSAFIVAVNNIAKNSNGKTWTDGTIVKYARSNGYQVSKGKNKNDEENYVEPPY